jgi:hypothetical protein
MIVEVYKASTYVFNKYNGHVENGRTLLFVGDAVKYISLETPDFFPSIASNLKKMTKIQIDINGGE